MSQAEINKPDPVMNYLGWGGGGGGGGSGNTVCFPQYKLS